MTDKGSEKRSGFRDMPGMMKMMRNCMPGNEGGHCCAAMMGSESGAEGCDCSTMMKAYFGSEGSESGETSAKA